MAIRESELITPDRAMELFREHQAERGERNVFFTTEGHLLANDENPQVTVDFAADIVRNQRPILGLVFLDTEGETIGASQMVDPDSRFLQEGRREAGQKIIDAVDRCAQSFRSILSSLLGKNAGELLYEFRQNEKSCDLINDHADQIQEAMDLLHRSITASVPPTLHVYGLEFAHRAYGGAELLGVASIAEIDSLVDAEQNIRRAAERAAQKYN